ASAMAAVGVLVMAKVSACWLALPVHEPDKGIPATMGDMHGSTPALTVVIAPDSFKGTLAALDVAEAIAAGWRSVRPEDLLELFPQADGGEGTLDAVAGAVPGAVRRDAGPVTGPDRRPAPGQWLELPDGAAVV